MKIRWNEVTWYSKLLTLIFILGFLPALAFYIGTQYELVTNPAPIATPPQFQAKKLAPTSDQSNITSAELLNATYPEFNPASASSTGNSQITYQNGFYESPIIHCNGVSTCPDGQHFYSKIVQTAFENNGTAAVFIAGGYAPDQKNFEKNLLTKRPEFAHLYGVTTFQFAALPGKKSVGSKLIVTNSSRDLFLSDPYDFSWGAPDFMKFDAFSVDSITLNFSGDDLVALKVPTTNNDPLDQWQKMNSTDPNFELIQVQLHWIDSFGVDKFTLENTAG